MLRRPSGGQAREPILRSVLGADRPAHDPIIDPHEAQTGGTVDNQRPLERDGLIRIERVASDRRAKELHLTKAGEKRLQAALKGWSQAQARFETVFGAKRAADLRALLRAAVASQFAPAEQFTDR